MSSDRKDYKHLLPGRKPLSRQVSEQELDKLKKGFQKVRRGEPANTGITKEVGSRLFVYAAEDAEERMKAKKNG